MRKWSTETTSAQEVADNINELQSCQLDFDYHPKSVNLSDAMKLIKGPSYIQIQRNQRLKSLKSVIVLYATDFCLLLRRIQCSTKLLPNQAVILSFST